MRLRKERKAANLTQEDLERISGVAQSSISKIERGILLRPSFDTLERLAKALQRRGRKVEPSQLQPRPQPTLVPDLRSLRKSKGAA